MNSRWRGPQASSPKTSSSPVRARPTTSSGARSMEGIFAVNVESVHEIDRLARIAREAGKTHRCGTQDQPRSPAHGLGDAHGRDGRTVRHRPGRSSGRRYGRRSVEPNSSLRGIHVYTATQVFEVGPLLEHCRNILEISLAGGRPGRPSAGDDRLRRRLRRPLLREDDASSTSTASPTASASCSPPTVPIRASKDAGSSSSWAATWWPTLASTSRGPST